MKILTPKDIEELGLPKLYKPRWGEITEIESFDGVYEYNIKIGIVDMIKAGHYVKAYTFYKQRNNGYYCICPRNYHEFIFSEFIRDPVIWTPKYKKITTDAEARMQMKKGNVLIRHHLSFDFEDMWKSHLYAEFSKVNDFYLSHHVDYEFYVENENL